MPDVLILGCGFTGGRVKARLLARGLEVTGIRSSQIDFTKPGAVEQLRLLVTPGCILLHSVPTLPDAADAILTEAFEDRPKRVVYLSTTSVYGSAEWVNEQTPIQPRTPRERARARTETAVEMGCWETLILRPAAIYGPGRGVQAAMRQGRYHLAGDGSNFISRIHVDDLAAITEAALLSGLTGAYPVADLHPCPAREIAEYCSNLLGLPLPQSSREEDVPESRRANRRVDGTAICRSLGVELRYRSYLEGIPASL